VHAYYPTLLPPNAPPRRRRISVPCKTEASPRGRLRIFSPPVYVALFEDQSYGMDAGENRSNSLANRTVRWETQSRDGSDDFRKDGATLGAVV
jgi:hypothetical protein